MDDSIKPTIICQLIGGPKTYNAAEGEWESSIGRHAVESPVEVSSRGLAGDSVADTKNHGSLDQAICCHSASHYNFWNEEYGLTGTSRALEYGAIGENWTLTGADETNICIGDIFEVGTAIVQVSQPRVPCWKQEAKNNLSNLVQRTVETLKTGFYLRVMTPGVVTVGDSMILKSRPHPDITIYAISNLRIHGIGAEIALEASDANELAFGWRNAIAKMLT
jgi:MOSC domain-containing protein YiiM